MYVYVYIYLYIHIMYVVGCLQQRAVRKASSAEVAPTDRSCTGTYVSNAHTS